jgi:hypothetical protein
MGERLENISNSADQSRRRHVLHLPEDGRPWSSASSSASTKAWSGSRGACFQRLLPERPTPERCVEAYYLQRTRFERVAEGKVRHRVLTEDGNVEISGRDFR